MKDTLQYLPDRHTDFPVKLTLESPQDVVVIVGVAVLVVFLAWRFAVRRRRRR